MFVIRGFCSSSLSAILVISLYVQSCDTSQILVMRLPANRIATFVFSRNLYDIVILARLDESLESELCSFGNGKRKGERDHSFSIKQPPPNVGTESSAGGSEFVLYGIGDFPFQYDNAQSVVRFSREQPKQLSYQKISPER